jgi:hypothetical protein
MRVEVLTVGSIQANCYIVWGLAKKALVIDPGGEADRIFDFLKEMVRSDFNSRSAPKNFI